jgi:hypothetical protein
VRLSAEERERLDELIRTGKRPAQLLTKAPILPKADAAETGDGWSTGDEASRHAYESRSRRDDEADDVPAARATLCWGHERAAPTHVAARARMTAKGWMRIGSQRGYVFRSISTTELLGGRSILGICAKNGLPSAVVPQI